MGCDIHMFIEHKIGKGKWTPHPKHEIIDEDGIYQEISATGRNYLLFSLLAGVRSYVGYGPEPKGLPTNISKVVKKAYNWWEGDAHSSSYLTLKQFEAAIKAHNKKEEEFKINPTDRVDLFYGYNKDYKKQPPAFSTIVSACKKQVEELQADYILLDEEPPTIKHRLIFWFDN